MSETRDSKNIKSANRGLPIEQLLSAPMMAASKANAMLSKEQANFLLDYCFSLKEGVYRPVMINMALTRSIMIPSDKADVPPQMKQIVTNFHLPLVTFIPINSLAVNDVEVNFELEITSVQTISGDSNTAEPESDPSKNTTLFGSLSYDSKEAQAGNGKNQYSRRNHAKMSVSMKAGPLPLPLGISSIIDMYAKNINPQGQPSYISENDK